VKRVDYEAEAMERDPVEGSDVPVEGWASENSHAAKRRSRRGRRGLR
jgi:hypothetical protein